MGIKCAEELAVGIPSGSDIAAPEFAGPAAAVTSGSRFTAWAPVGVVFGVAAVASFYLPIFAERIHRVALPVNTVPQAQAEPELRLSMRALREADTVLISWDPKAVAARHATQGFLHVRDGSEEKDLRLDAGQVAAGLMSYSAHSADLMLRLEFRNARGRIATQSIRLLGGTRETAESAMEKAALALQRTPTAPPRTVSQPGPVTEERLSGSIAREADTSSTRQLTVDDKTLQVPATHERTAPEQEASKFVPPVFTPLVQPRVQPENRLPVDAPALSASTPATASQLDATIDRLTATPPPPAPIRSTATPTQPGSVATQPKPLILDPNAGNYAPPRPVKWASPSAKKSKVSLSAPVDIALKIHIDEFGHVTKIRAVNDGQKARKDLLKIADDSVRRWVFEPAKYKGKPIATEDTIVLRIEK